MDYIEDVQEPQHSEGTPVDDNTEDYIATSPELRSEMRGEMCDVRADIRKIARKTNSKPSKKLKRFCMRNLNPNLTIDQAPADAVAMLIWADFPTSLCVKHYRDSKAIPTWNIFSVDLAATAFEIASTYVADQGWFACTSLPEHFPIVDSFAEAFGFSLHRCLNILCEAGYVRHNPGEEVVLLVIALYHRTRCLAPTIHRQEANQVDRKAFSTKAKWIMDFNSATLTTVDNVICRGGAERSPSFCRFLVELLTQPGDVVLDLFVGTGNIHTLEYV